MAEKKLTLEEFATSLEDVVAVLTVLKGYFQTSEELYDSCNLALENETHAKLLLGLVLKGKK